MELKKLRNLAIAESGYIFDPASGHSYTANETAVFIINELKHEKNSKEIRVSLSEQYEIGENSAENDIMRVIEQLQANFLIQELP